MILEFLAGAALAAAVVTQEPQAEQKKAPDAAQSPASVADRPVSLPSRPTSIPMELRDNLVIIDAMVNGQQQRAVLDSGSSAMIVNQEFARRIGLAQRQSVGDVAGAGEQAQQLHPVDISRLVVGPLQFDNLPGYSVNLDELSSSAGFPIDFLIGAPAFKYGAVSVDYKQSRVTFGPSGSMGKCAAPIPLAIVEGAPIVEVELRQTLDSEPIRLKLVVDLGTRHRAIMVGGPFVRSEKGQALMRSGASKQVGHGTGGAVQGSVARVAQLRLGQTSVADMEVALTSGSAAFETGLFDGTLGVPFWKGGVITFDYQANSLCIDR